MSGILAKISAGEIGTLALYGAQPLQIEGHRRVGIVTCRDELAREPADRTCLAHPVKDPASLAEAVEETSLAKQLQMSRYPRLTLPENLGQFADGQLATRAQYDKPQSSRLGDCAQGGQ
jgi:hypothetical protein